MENSNTKSDDNAASQQNPNTTGGDAADNGRRRTPFTDLSQVDADLALARTLQQQERAYMMLRMESGDVSDYGSWEADNYGHEGVVTHNSYDGLDLEVGGEVDNDDEEVEEEDAFGVLPRTDGLGNGNENSELDPSSFSSDEAYARALQNAEEREVAARLAGINEIIEIEDDDNDEEDNNNVDELGDNSQDAWEEVDPDELSYEELVALGDIVGTESRGLSAEKIASLPSINYKSRGVEEVTNDSCVICRLEFEADDALTLLPCKHPYHRDCINNWLHINRVCPVCSTEVSTSDGPSNG